jgi:Flp pilus assembly protein TadG
MRNQLVRFWHGVEGLAAVEFAFVLPIILAMLLGLVELSHASGVRTQVINMASTASDLIAQEAASTGSDMDTAFAATKAILFPHDTKLAAITITSVIDGGAGKSPVIAWSCSMQGPNAVTTTPFSKGANPSPALPNGLLTAGSGGSVIWSRVTYKYTSFLRYFLPGTKTWTNDFYAKPRRVLQIPYTSSPASASGTCKF